LSAELRAALVSLEERLRTFGAPIIDAFRPAADTDYIKETLAREGLAAHEDVLAWFGWHDGALERPPERDANGTIVKSYGADTTLVGPWWMFTLDEAVQNRRMHLDIICENYVDLGDEDLLRGSWLPVATSLGSGELCVDTDASGPAPLYVLDQETLHEGPREQFASLTEFASAMTRALDEGLVIPHPYDSRAAMVDFPALPDELRPLSQW
jgi:hypothetical protein